MTTSASGEQYRPIRRALISVYDKTGLEQLALGLHEAGVTLVGTGSTAARIAALDIPVTRVEELTGFPECLDGRVKTLHPLLHAGILADLRLPAHREQLAEFDVQPFDLVVSNLYPFRETIASGAAPDECVEQIDVGGPTMVRAAAKNHPSVAIVTSPAHYPDVLRAAVGDGFDLAERKRLAGEAFRHTAEYDIAVAGWFADTYATETDSAADDADAQPSPFPEFLATGYRRGSVLRYGENPHQAAALYVDAARGGGLADAEQLHGKEMSYNNYTDTDAARRAAYDHAEPCVAIIKHANPCGIAVGEDLAAAHRKAHACDPVSAYGGVIAVNRPVTPALAEQVSEVFTEVVLAPEYDEEAVRVLSRKKNIRLLRCPDEPRPIVEQRAVSGGLLVQQVDRYQADGDDPANWTLAAGDPLDADGLRDLAFAWRTVRAVKSNAIVLAADGASVGVGMGQVNRVDAARLAVRRAGEERTSGAVAASDAFFPFDDGLRVLTEAGVRAVVQPGGSKRDDESIAAAREAGAALYLTGTRHFFH